MFDLIKNIVSYLGSENYDEIIVSAAVVMVVLVSVIVIDNIFRMLRAFVNINRHE